MQHKLAASLLIAAMTIAAGPAFAAPKALTDTQLGDVSAGRGGKVSYKPNSGNRYNIIFAPNISITNQIAIAVAINGNATASNVNLTSQLNNIVARLR